jgi:hypothetical protein
MHPAVQTRQPWLQFRLILFPRQPVHPRAQHPASRRRDCPLLVTCNFTLTVQVAPLAGPALSPGAVACSIWSVAFPPGPPPMVADLCSNTSSVLRDRPTPHQRAAWTSGSWPSQTGPPQPARRTSMGSPGSRARSFHACEGSQTARSPTDARDCAPAGVAFPHAEPRRNSGRD